jgi:hypothetical protein
MKKKISITAVLVIFAIYFLGALMSAITFSGTELDVKQIKWAVEFIVFYLLIFAFDRHKRTEDN